MLGAIRHTEYILSEDENGPYQQFEVVNARRENRSDDPTPIDGRYTAELITDVIPAGFAYTFQRGEFHASSVEELTITVVLKLDQHPTFSRILGNAGVVPMHGFQHQPMSEGEIATWVERAATALRTR